MHASYCGITQILLGKVMKVIGEWIKYEIKHEQQMLLAYILNDEHNSSWLFTVVYAEQRTMINNMSCA